MNPFKKTTLFALVVFITTIVLVGLGYAMQQVDVETLPKEWRPTVEPIVVFVSSGAGLFAISLGRNLIGFLRNWIGNKGDETYDMTRLYTTWCYYYGSIGTILSLPVPSPYKEIFIVIIVVLDFLTSELKKVGIIGGG